MYELTHVSPETFDSVLALCNRYANERDAQPLVHAPTWVNLLCLMMETDTAFVLLKDDVAVGVFLALSHPNIMNPNLLALTPLVTYIVPEHRYSRGGALILNKLDELAKWHDITTIGFSPEAGINERTMNRRGYKLLETIYIKDQT